MDCLEERIRTLLWWLVVGTGILILLLLAIAISADLRATGVSPKALPEAVHRLPSYTFTSLSTVSSLARWLPTGLGTAMVATVRYLSANLGWGSAIVVIVLIFVLRYALALLRLALKLLIMAVVFFAAMVMLSLSDLVTRNYPGTLQPSAAGAEYSRLVGVHCGQVKSFGADHLAILTVAVLSIFLLRAMFARKFARKPEVARFTEIWI